MGNPRRFVAVSRSRPGGPLGGGVGAYGERSPFEAATHRVRGSRYDQAAGSLTPLQDLNGSITPSALHFERHHAGIPKVDPSQHRLLIDGLVDRQRRSGHPADWRPGFPGRRPAAEDGGGATGQRPRRCGTTSTAPCRSINREPSRRTRATRPSRMFSTSTTSSASMTRSTPLPSRPSRCRTAMASSPIPVRISPPPCHLVRSHPRGVPHVPGGPGARGRHHCRLSSRCHGGAGGVRGRVAPTLGRSGENKGVPRFKNYEPGVCVRSTTMSHIGLSRVPTTLPAKAAASQSQPCRLARRDAAEICTDVAPVGEPGAIAEQQSTADRRSQGPSRHGPGRLESTRQPRRHQGTEENAEVHHRRRMLEDAANERRLSGRGRPVCPRGRVEADHRRRFSSPTVRSPT